MISKCMHYKYRLDHQMKIQMIYNHQNVQEDQKSRIEYEKKYILIYIKNFEK